MGFEQNPDYEFLRGLFRKVMSKENYAFDNQYDWSSKEKTKVKIINYTRFLRISLLTPLKQMF
jgi:hypothetical protein